VIAGVLQAMMSNQFVETVIDIDAGFAERGSHFIMQAQQDGTIYIGAVGNKKLDVLRIDGGAPASGNQIEFDRFNGHFSTNGDLLAVVLQTGEVVVTNTRTGDEAIRIKLENLQRPKQEGLVALTDAHIFYCGIEEDSDYETVAHFQAYDLGTGRKVAEQTWQSEEFGEPEIMDMKAVGDRALVLLSTDAFLLQACHHHSIFEHHSLCHWRGCQVRQ
jgi:hypothetical protein